MALAIRLLCAELGERALTVHHRPCLLQRPCTLQTERYASALPTNGSDFDELVSPDEFNSRQHEEASRYSTMETLTTGRTPTRTEHCRSVRHGRVRGRVADRELSRQPRPAHRCWTRPGRWQRV